MSYSLKCRQMKFERKKYADYTATQNTHGWAEAVTKTKESNIWAGAVT